MQLSRRTQGIALLVFVLSAMVLSVLYRGSPPSGPYRPVNAARPSFDRAFLWPTGTSLRRMLLWDIPTAGNRVWILLVTASGGLHRLLIDTDRNKMIGQLNEAWPQCLNEQGRLVCSTLEFTGSGLLSHTVGRLPDPLNLGHVPAGSLREEFWLLDINDPKLRVPLAHIHTPEPSKWERWSTVSPHVRIFLSDDPLNQGRLHLRQKRPLAIDLEKKVAWRLADGLHLTEAWLDDSTLASIGADNNIYADNVISGTGAPRLSSASFDNFLKTNGLPRPGHLVPRAVPGTNLFYFSASLSGGSNWLASYTPATSNLTLISTAIPNGRDPAYNASGTHCLYHGDHGDAYVYEISSGKISTVQLPAKVRLAQPSLLKSNRVVYVSTNGLESCDLNGGDRRIIFPRDP